MPKPIADYGWEELYAYTFNPGGMEGDITIITDAHELTMRELFKQFSENEVDTNFAGFVQSQGYVAIDAVTACRL